MLQKFDERNRDLIVSVGGQLTHRDQAGVSPFDSAARGGDAVWEGLRLTDGRIFALDEHLARLRRSAHALAFAVIPSDAEIVAEIRRTLAANRMRDGVHIRLTLTRGVKITSGMDPRLNASGPTLIVLAEFKDPVYDLAGIRLITSSVRRTAPDSLDPKIHHSNLLTSILAKIEANVAGADDAVLLDHQGFVAETNATHISMVIPAAGALPAAGRAPGAGGVTLATPTTAACPEGITRATVLRLAAEAGIAVAEGDYTLPQLSHGTFVVERRYPASPARVFAAWTDAGAKQIWMDDPDYKPDGAQHELDFRVGGHERFGGLTPGARATATTLAITTSSPTTFLDGIDKPEDREGGTTWMLDNPGKYLASSAAG